MDVPFEKITEYCDNRKVSVNVLHLALWCVKAIRKPCYPPGRRKPNCSRGAGRLGRFAWITEICIDMRNYPSLIGGTFRFFRFWHYPAKPQQIRLDIQRRKRP